MKPRRTPSGGGFLLINLKTWGNWASFLKLENSVTFFLSSSTCFFTLLNVLKDFCCKLDCFSSKVVLKDFAKNSQTKRLTIFTIVFFSHTQSSRFECKQSPLPNKLQIDCFLQSFCSLYYLYFDKLLSIFASVEIEEMFRHFTIKMTFSVMIFMTRPARGHWILWWITYKGPANIMG